MLRAPMRMVGGFWGTARMPGIWLSAGRSSAMIWSTLLSRLDSGFRRAMMRPVLEVRLGPDAPVTDMVASTSGCWATRSTRSFWRSRMAGKEMPSSASVDTRNWPVSSLGKKPWGMRVKSQAVRASRAREPGTRGPVAQRCARRVTS